MRERAGTLHVAGLSSRTELEPDYLTLRDSFEKRKKIDIPSSYCSFIIPVVYVKSGVCNQPPVLKLYFT